MGQLPTSRVTISRAFANVGVDFAGPFSCKCVAHRSIKFYKSYAVIFVCFATHAVHIKVMSALSTEAFLLCLQRFVGRRGTPRNIYSDNATNFVGAKNMLLAGNSSIQNYAYKKSFNWVFIPPKAPHHGISCSKISEVTSRKSN